MCWLVDPLARAVSVLDFTGALPDERTARGLEAIRSSVLPSLQTSAFGLFL